MIRLSDEDTGRHISEDVNDLKRGRTEIISEVMNSCDEYREMSSVGNNTPPQRRSSSAQHHQRMKEIWKDTIEIQSGESLDLDGTKKAKTSIWKRFAKKCSNIANVIKYNTLTLNSSFDYFHSKSGITLFAKTYDNQNKADLPKFCSDVYFTIYFSYRTWSIPLQNSQTKESFTNDCGWGCMIRSGQMILAKALQEIKLHQALTEQLDICSSEAVNASAIFDTIALFMEEPLNFSDVKSSKPFVNMCRKYSQEFAKSSEDAEIKIEENAIKHIIAPFSIKNICKFGEIYGKFPGDWFSDVNIVRIVSNINSQFQPFPEVEILTFESVIYHQEIIDKCLEIFPSSDDNRKYILKKMGIIFVSIRLGLNSISNEYLQSLRDIFSIPNNLGFIGGKSGSAAYFIGCADNNVFYFDPHFTHKSAHSIEEMKKQSSTFLTKEIYQMPIKTIRPALTIGFHFKTIEEYEDLVNNFVLHSSLPHPCFKFCYLGGSQPVESVFENEIKKNNVQINDNGDDF